jgi:hypothetical protein
VRSVNRVITVQASQASKKDYSKNNKGKKGWEHESNGGRLD